MKIFHEYYRKPVCCKQLFGLRTIKINNDYGLRVRVEIDRNAMAGKTLLEQAYVPVHLFIGCHRQFRSDEHRKTSQSLYNDDRLARIYMYNDSCRGRSSFREDGDERRVCAKYLSNLRYVYRLQRWLQKFLHQNHGLQRVCRKPGLF